MVEITIRQLQSEVLGLEPTMDSMAFQKDIIRRSRITKNSMNADSLFTRWLENDFLIDVVFINSGYFKPSLKI